MLHKTKGLSLHYYKYSESSVIAKIFTSDFGLLSFFINGIRQKKSKNKLGFLQPFTFLNLEISYKSKSKLSRIKEMSPYKIHYIISRDINRQLISIFVSEVLLKVLIEGEKDIPLFCFLEGVANDLECNLEIPNIYPLKFLLDLSKFLGFLPSKLNSTLPYFDLLNGCFSKIGSEHNYYINGDDLNFFKSILFNKNESIPKSYRKKILLILLDYYKLHHHELKNLKSFKVIEDLGK